MRADEAAESVSCPPSAILSLSYPLGPVFVFPPLASAPTCLVYPFNTSLSNRLLHFAVCCSCNIVPRPLLSRSPPTRLSFRRADARRLGESIDLRDSDRRDPLARDQGPIDRIISEPVAVSSAFAGCGEAKERGKVIKSAIVLCNCRRID